jgi:hypothetical protein
MSIAAIAALVNLVTKVLKDLGVVKDPAQVAQMQLQTFQLLQQKETQESEEFQTFLKETTPDPAYVYRWANTLIALTRPLITWVVTGSIVTSFFVPGEAAKLTATVAAFSQGGTAGLMILSIPLWWFAGRTAEKLWAGPDTVASIPAPSGSAPGAPKTQTNAPVQGPYMPNDTK